jgi:hypothetical protein
MIFIFHYGDLLLSKIKRIILDVLKPHKPSILEIADRLGDLDGISGVNISLEEIDTNTHSVKITIEGIDINYKKVEETILDCGASIHSIDGVSAGMKIVEEVETPQDR